VSLAGFSHLRRASCDAAFTVALLHIALHTHRGGGFDLLDLLQMVRAPEFSLRRAAALWRRHNLVHLVLPPLTVLDTLCPVVPDDVWVGLFSDLSLLDQLLLRSGWGTLRRRSFLASLHGQSLMELLVEGLLGTREITQNRTGCTPRQPLFWFHHLLGLPVKRTLKFWRFRR